MNRKSPLRRPDLTLSQQTPARQRLITRMQQLGFCTIHNLRICSGEPILDPPPRVISRKKHGGINQPRLQAGMTNFALKREVVELLNDFDAIGNGTILRIEVAHGLPILHEVEEDIRF